MTEQPRVPAPVRRETALRSKDSYHRRATPMAAWASSSREDIRGRLGKKGRRL